MLGLRSAAAPKPERAGVLAVLQEQPTADRVQGIMHELQLDDELTVTDTLDAALRRIRSGYAPRVLLLDLADVSRADRRGQRGASGRRRRSEARRPRHRQRCRAVPRPARRRRQRLSGQAVDPRDLVGCLGETVGYGGTGTGGGLGQVIVFIGSRGGVGATTTAVSCAWLMAEERSERSGAGRSRSAFRHRRAQARYRSRQRVVRGAGAAFAHRQPVHRARHGQGDATICGCWPPRRRRPSI